MHKKIIQKIVISFILIAFVAVPFLAQAKPYYNPPYRKDVGLNAHWALGGFGKDQQYNDKLFESKTRWAREHFYTEVFMVDNPDAWFERYDTIMQNYQDQDVKIVGMLAYGINSNEYFVPDMDQWLSFVDTVVNRYKDKVEVWEVWNEPDSADFLDPNSAENYAPLLSATYDKIKSVDSTAKVMNGGLAQPNVDFAQALFANARDKFDIFNVHYYYAEKYVQDGNLNRLEEDAKRLKNYVHSQKPGMPIWVTEFGASTGSWGVSEEVQKTYLEEASRLLLQGGYANRLFVYNIRNFDYNTNYENNFGLLDVNMSPRPAWDWYLSIPRGPYDKERMTLSEENASAAELKTDLEKYFGAGLIPISAENWATVVQSYTYGGYSVQAIVQAIRFGGKTVHPQYSAKFWSQTQDYKDFINKDWTGGLIVYAYGEPRIKVTDEGKKAEELLLALKTHHDYSKLRITVDDWGDLVKAYVYGGYPVSAIARAVVTDWKTVSRTEKYETYKNSVVFKEGMESQL
ncbi:glycoside hydrolase family protein [Patescibacteria group bacterium]|nr:glycoside hydrolase family protein [Patescibacteria group bacterium]